MKVIIKSGINRNQEIVEFFKKNIFPILKYGIAIEHSANVIVVYEKKDGEVIKKVDPTAEVIVELSEEARNLAINPDTPIDVLQEKSGDFFDEALAIMEIEKFKPPFSREYYSCRYAEASTAKE